MNINCRRAEVVSIVFTRDEYIPAGKANKGNFFAVS